MSQKQLQQGQKRILVVDDEPDLTMILPYNIMDSKRYI